MRVDNFVCKFGLVIVTAKLGTHSPQYNSDEKQRCRGSQPLPKERLRRSTGWLNRAEMCVNFPPQRHACRLIYWRKLQSTTQPIHLHELNRALGEHCPQALAISSSAIT